VADAVFALDADTGGLVDGTAAAADKLEQLKAVIEKDQAALKELEAKMKLLQSGGAVNIAQFKQMKEQLEGKKTSIRNASTEYSNLGGKLSAIGKHQDAFGKSMKDAEAKAKPLSKSIREVGESAGRLGGPAGLPFLGPLISGLGTAMESPILASAVLAVGVIALAAALVAGAAALAFFAFKSADAARTQRIMLGAVAGSEEAGERLGDTIGNIAKDIPIAQKALQDLAVAFTNKGLKGDDLENALRAVSRSTAVLGQQAGSKLQSVVEKSKELKKFMAKAVDFEGTGVTLDDVAKSLAARTKTSFANAKAAIQAGSVDLSTGLQALDDASKTKLGDSADQMKLSFGAIGERASQVFGSLFDDLDIEPVLAVLSRIVELFDEDATEGQALREIMKTVFQPIFDFLGSGAGDALVGFIDNVILGAQQVVIWMLEAKNSITAFARDPIGELNRLGKRLEKVGENIVDGIVAGIKAKGPKIAEELVAQVTGATDVIDVILKMRSPSLVMRHKGEMMMAGMTEGIESEAPAVERAAIAATTNAANANAANDNGGKSAGGRGDIHIHEGAIVISGVKGADDPSFMQRLTEALLQVIATSGAPEPA
jgi:uncharacterized protein YoxC